MHRLQIGRGQVSGHMFSRLQDAVSAELLGEADETRLPKARFYVLLHLTFLHCALREPPARQARGVAASMLC